MHKEIKIQQDVTKKIIQYDNWQKKVVRYNNKQLTPSHGYNAMKGKLS